MPDVSRSSVEAQCITGVRHRIGAATRSIPDGSASRGPRSHPRHTRRPPSPSRSDLDAACAVWSCNRTRVSPERRSPHPIRRKPTKRERESRTRIYAVLETGAKFEQQAVACNVTLMRRSVRRATIFSENHEK